MPDNFAIVTLQTDSGLLEDFCVNTFSFGTELSKDETTGEVITDAISAFYQEVDAYLSVALNGVATVQLYDRADDPPRLPWFEAEILFTPSTSYPIPSEVALCLSFHAQFVSGEARARRRGRVYIGPLSANALSGDTSNQRPNSTFLGKVRDAGQGLAQAAVDSEGVFSWDVWSTVDEVGHSVVGGWVDNAWDTQRRRGIAATARTLWAPA